MSAKTRFTLTVFSLVGVVLLASCGGGSQGGGLTRSDFDFLRLGMSYQEVVAQVGEAHRDAGSGITVMIYELSDGTEMMLSFPTLDNLIAVHLYDPEDDTRQVILGP